MSKIINNIVQIIYLAKKAKEDVKKNNLTNSRKLFKILQNINEQEIHLIKKESYSKKLFKNCLIIYDHLKNYDFSNNEKQETLDILNKIIELENIDLELINKENEGLKEEILKKIDPYIRDLSYQISKLFFVDKTLQSCQGSIKLKDNPEFSLFNPYIVIKYKSEKEYFSHIKLFHSALKKIATHNYKYEQDVNSFNYQFGFDNNSYAKLKEQVNTSKELFLLVEKSIISKWKLVARLVEKFSKNNKAIKLDKNKFNLHH